MLKPGAPEGLRDILPAAAKARRALEARLREAFEDGGFGEIICPTFDFYDSLAVEASPTVKQDMVRFIDGDGRLMALRPEMTTAIARTAAQRFASVQGAHRLYYIANVFRQVLPRQGRPKEFWQAGVEFIGGGPDGDYEVVSLFIGALERAGLSGFQVGLGQVDFLGGALNALPITEDRRSELRTALADHNLVAFETAVSALELDPETAGKLLAIPGLRGGKEVLTPAERLIIGDPAQAAWENLKEIYDRLASAGLADRIIIDLGLLRSFDYYTGLIFEAYMPGLGVPLGGGGRYDRLLAEFGREAPAAGFAFALERLEAALELKSPGRTDG